MQSPTLAIQAECIAPVQSPPIEQGWVVIDRGIVLFVGPHLPARYESVPRLQLPNVAILPGLVNAHCHLEFSDLTEPIPAGKSFPDWIAQVIAKLRSLNDPEQIRFSRIAALQKGIAESYQAGVRWVVDMATAPYEAEWIDKILGEAQREFCKEAWCGNLMPMTVQPLAEVVDVSEMRMEQTWSQAEKQIDAPESMSRGRAGLAPHASYTVSSELSRLVSERSRQDQRLVAMHLAESVDEMEWLNSRSGAFERLLNPLLNDRYWQAPRSVEAHLQNLIYAHRCLVVHGNFLEDSALAMLALYRSSMAIVHCPRTFAHFGHANELRGNYPWKKRQEQGIVQLIGTDSRASNPDLNLWKDAQRLRLAQVGSLDILQALTHEAAKLLEIGERYGALQSGTPALLTAVVLESSNQITDWHDRILATATRAMPLEIAIRGMAPSA